MAVARTESRTAGPTPSLEEVRELARNRNLIPVHETFIDDCQTPVSAFLKLRGDDPAFLLESADQGRVGRYSFIGVRPRKVLRWSLGDPGDPYALAAQELDRYRPAPALPDIPPFVGGAVGMFAYDLVRTVEPLGEPNPDPVGLPDLALMLTDALVAFDHLKHTVTVLANAYADEDLDASYAQALDTIAEIRWRLGGAVSAATAPPPRDTLAAGGTGPATRPPTRRRAHPAGVRAKHAA
jgi:anthranilate synthase component I